MSKKVTFIADCLVTQKAGIHFYAEQFIRRVIKEYPQNEYTVITSGPYSKLDCTELHIPINKLIPGHYRLRYFREIPRQCIELESDIVIEMAHFGPFNLPEKIKTATVIHDLTPITHPSWHTLSNSAGHKQFLPKVLKKSDYLIANSITTKEALIGYNNKTKEKILVSTPKLSKAKRNRDDSLKKEKIILTVGTIEPRKNFATLLEAFQKVNHHLPEYKLIIAGSWGWKSNKIKKLVEKSTANIEVTGYVSEQKLNHLYHNAALFVFPSLYEGYGLPLIEAMYHSLPIIGSDIPSTREVCSDHIRYFIKDDNEALQEQILDCLTNENKLMALSNASSTRFKELDSAQLGLEELFS